jgi:hypothetical protein
MKIKHKGRADKFGTGQAAVPKRGSKNGAGGQADVQHSDAPKYPVYSGGSIKSTMVAKTVKYRCGCEVRLSAFGPSECSCVCEEHCQPIQRITRKFVIV